MGCLRRGGRRLGGRAWVWEGGGHCGGAERDGKGLRWGVKVGRVDR